MPVISNVGLLGIIRHYTYPPLVIPTDVYKCPCCAIMFENLVHCCEMDYFRIPFPNCESTRNQFPVVVNVVSALLRVVFSKLVLARSCDLFVMKMIQSPSNVCVWVHHNTTGCIPTLLGASQYCWVHYNITSCINTTGCIIILLGA